MLGGDIIGEKRVCDGKDNIAVVRRHKADEHLVVVDGEAVLWRDALQTRGQSSRIFRHL